MGEGGPRAKDHGELIASTSWSNASPASQRRRLARKAALIAALASGRIAGAHLDAFAHEPLAADSPLWGAANVIVTPHSAGHSDGNEERVRAAFLANLRRWLAGDALLHEVAAISSP